MVLESIAAGPYFTEKNPIPSANVFPTKNNKRPNGTSGSKYLICVNVNIRMYNFDDVQCTVIPSVAYGFVTGMNLQLC